MTDSITYSTIRKIYMLKSYLLSATSLKHHLELEEKGNPNILGIRKHTIMCISSLKTMAGKNPK